MVTNHGGPPAEFDSHFPLPRSACLLQGTTLEVLLAAEMILV